jgi:hypothetical protein
MKKFRGFEQNKGPWSIGKWRHELATSEAKRCLKKTTMDYTHKTTSNGVDIFGLSHMKDQNYMQTFKTHVKPRKRRGVILLKATLMTCGTKEKNWEKYTRATFDHQGLSAFNSGGSLMGAIDLILPLNLVLSWVINCASRVNLSGWFLCYFT